MRRDICLLQKCKNPSHPACVLKVRFPITVNGEGGKRWRTDETFASRLAGFCDYELMTGPPRFLPPVLAGCVVTILQVLTAVALLAPEGPAVERYFALVQHVSYWFMNIID